MTETISNPQGQKETLDRILEDLRSSDIMNCLAAIRRLGMINFSSEAVVRQLKILALGENAVVRNAALEALDLRTSLFVASKLSSLVKADRNIVLTEIEAWQQSGLIESHRAEVLRRQYDFDTRAGITPNTAPVPQEKPLAHVEESVSTSPPMPSTAAPAQPSPILTTTPRPAPAPQPAPSRSLMEVLLSETSIKIYLYLGAFFVIAAAAILAALVEAARLPVLLIATALFAAGAIGLKKRLPQPSFALAIVFSFLLPIDANVLADSLSISIQGNDIYWTFVFLLMALIWAFGTWFYQSRLFSVVAFLSLGLAGLRFGEIFRVLTEWNIFSVAVVNLIGLFGVFLLKRWKDQKFAQPLFLFANVQQIVMLAISFSAVIIGQFEFSTMGTGEWIAVTLTWILAASFYVASDIIIPFIFFPWMAVASLFLMPWFLLSVFDASDPVHVAGFAVWGIIHALASELVRRIHRPSLEKYHYPLLAWSLPLFFMAITLGLAEDIWYGFAAFLFTGITYTVINLIRSRWYIWTTALLAGLGAYFSFFNLPFMHNVEVNFAYQLLGASLLLLVPELFFRERLTFERHWNWPPVLLGTILAGWNLMLSGTFADYDKAAIVFGFTALLALGYAIHLNRPPLGYLATASAALAANFTLQHFNREEWLPALTVLAVLFYIGGFLLARNDERKLWGTMLVNSGLALGGLISLLALILSEPSGGWYTLVIAALFIVEMFERKNSWLELFAEAVLSISLLLILDDLKFHQVVYQTFGLGLLWLTCDMIFKRTFAERNLGVITIIISGMFALTSTFLLATDLAPLNAAICFAVYTFFTVAHAWLYKNPFLAYAPLVLFAFTMHFSAKSADVTAWIFPQIAVAAIYYLSGFFLRRSGKAKDWDLTLLFSGLGLGTFIAVVSPFQSGGLEKSIPIAIAATLYAAEAFARKNVWLGFPANILYLLAYFVILNELNVDEPQFFTVGAAALGLLQHYLLRRAGQKPAAFITGLVSQLVLLGASYIQMINTGELKYFFLLFFQALVVLVYGIVVRSRSLIIAPIGFVVLAVITVLYNALKDLSLVFIIGITGLILLALGILAVVMRERITNLAERFSDWDA